MSLGSPSRIVAGPLRLPRRPWPVRWSQPKFPPIPWAPDLCSATDRTTGASSHPRTGSQTGLDASLENSERNNLAVIFEATSAYWTDIYEFGDVDGAIYRQRRSVVLALAQKLALPAESPILEIGCGSGMTSVQLAREGYTIQAVDSVGAMIKRTRQHAEEACVGDRVITSMRDVYDLGYADNTFDLVLKIGVAPWLYTLEKAVREVVRVLRPGGYLITTADNWWRLHRWLDPRYLPPLAPMRRQVRNVLERLALIGPPGVSAHLHSIRAFDDRLCAAGLTKIEGKTVGFGPFSFLGCKLLPD